MKRLIILIPFFLISILSSGQLIINEVLYDPSNNALDGDANGDGVYDQEDDSFIEFVNIGSGVFDASGYQIWDDTTNGSLRFVVPQGTMVPAGGALVVFGSGPLVGNFGGAVVLSADTTPSHLNFNNSGEVIAVKNASGTTVLTFDSDALSNNPNESYTRNPDITGMFEQHNDNTPLLFSPGLKIDSTAFISNVLVTSISVQGAGGVSTISTPGGTLQMEAMVMPTNASNATVTWSVPAGNTIATISSSGLLTAMGNGMVYIKASANDASGIMDSAAITITNQSIGLVENSNHDVSFYPNPAKGLINFSTPLNIESAKVYSHNGTLVLQASVEENRLSVESLASGVYVLEVKSGESISVLKLTIKH